MLLTLHQHFIIVVGLYYTFCSRPRQAARFFFSLMISDVLAKKHELQLLGRYDAVI